MGVGIRNCDHALERIRRPPTETSQRLFGCPGSERPPSVSRLGTVSGLDPIEELERRVGHRLNREELEGRR